MESRALIIANSTYDDNHFATLPAATADAAALAEVLGAPAIGGFEVETLVDVPQRRAMRALETFFTRAARDDLLLLHLSLHGWKDTRGRLHFIMRDTEPTTCGRRPSPRRSSATGWARAAPALSSSSSTAATAAPSP
ncbi:MAG: hypothetical protein HOV84_35820 [Streptomyces sp.]|nr:hypothetical protein [Streptomyces sp.]